MTPAALRSACLALLDQLDRELPPDADIASLSVGGGRESVQIREATFRLLFAGQDVETWRGHGTGTLLCSDPYYCGTDEDLSGFVHLDAEGRTVRLDVDERKEPT